MTYLEGLRVLDLSRVLAGPLATQILGDLGAEVLKVEPPWGDDTRRWGPPFQGGSAAYHQSANRGKASLVLDLKVSGDRGRLAALVAVADVVVDNFLPRVRADLGLCPEDLLRDHPRLVHLGVAGYRGTRAQDPGYDLVLQAESGFAAITGAREGAPHKVGVAVVDVLTGMMAANGTLAALYRRERTGRGAVLRVSMFQTALFSLVNVVANHFAGGEPTPRWGNDHPNIVPYGIFGTADRPVALGVGNDRQYRRLTEWLGVADAELVGLDNAGRVRRRDEVVAAIGAALRVRSSDEVLSALGELEIPCGPVLRPDEALVSSSTWDPGSILAVEHRGETYRSVASPIEGEGMRPSVGPPPSLGEGGQAMAASWLQGSGRPEAGTAPTQSSGPK